MCGGCCGNGGVEPGPGPNPGPGPAPDVPTDQPVKIQILDRHVSVGALPFSYRNTFFTRILCYLDFGHRFLSFKYVRNVFWFVYLLLSL